MMKKTILFSALLFIFSACEKTSDIKVPPNPPMMAVFGFVEHGQQVEIRLEEVVPVFGKTKRDPGPINGALVIVREGGNSYTFIETSMNSGIYQFPGPFQGEAGKTYELEVKKAGFPDLSASCKVPDYVPNTVTHNYVSVPALNNFSDSSRRVGFIWADRAGSIDYYRVSAVARFDGGMMEEPVGFADQNMSNDKKDGKDLFTGLGTIWNASGTSPNSLDIVFELMVVDVHAYKYMRTFDVAYYNDGNPFAEPVIMYTNIQGGIGVFGGVNRKFFNTKIY